ncbi:DUF3967 domain-containing protein [Bacillus sp. CDB3]|uniref:DUF3967 domain-containing protein n=1 Tax=Bacillus sp. CDB3 TaxID=360310 RepID=UPI0009D8C03E|nr:DUF3967 domain-containing protein [Bacillus sp. CDB3]OQR53336.1 hypothetical protein CDB3_30525 [Bacillus sp. CDB3]
MNEYYSEKAYWGKDVAAQLQIGRSTLTKWCIALETRGYSFVRGENNSRAFREQDIYVLQHMKDLVQSKNLTLDTAVNVILSKIETGTGGVHDENTPFQSEETYTIRPFEQLEEHRDPEINSLFSNLETMLSEFSIMKQELQEVKLQNNHLQELLKNNENQQLQLEHNRSIKEEYRDKQLMSLIRDTQEVKRLLATTQEKKPWWRFW